MNSRGYYQRKYGATDQINKILGELDQKKITNYHQGAVNELRFLPFSIHYLLSKLIDIAILPMNPYLSIHLPAYVEDFERTTGKTLEYSIDQIVEEGYLILRGKEWALNARYHNYERISEYESGKQKILIDFLKYLVDSVDTEKLQIQVEKEQLEELLASCDVSIEWMVEKELLICNQEKIYMNTFNWIWEKYGNAVLSNKYNEWMEKCGENQEQLQVSQEKYRSSKKGS